MNKASAQSESVQGGIDFPLFVVVLIDESGEVQDQIGYRFYASGAKVASEGWNKLSAFERNNLIAEVRPFDPQARKLRESQAKRYEQTDFKKAIELQIRESAGDRMARASSGMRVELADFLVHVISLTIEGRIRSAPDIGLVAKALERFCAQLIDMVEPVGIEKFHGWCDEEFEAARCGDMEDTKTQNALEAWFVGNEVRA